MEIPMLLEVPVGPQHPALHEPVLLKVYASGERVVRVEVNTGYNHRGIEKLAEKNTFYKDIFLVGRVCGICNTVHANCYVRALEALLDKEPPERAKYLRVLAMELERLHSHMLIEAVMAEILGYDTLFMHIMRDRELIMKAKEILTGARVLADYMMVGGVRRDLNNEKIRRLNEILDKVEPRLNYYMKLFEEDVTIRKRLEGVGVIPPRDIINYGLLGPIARASGLKMDARLQDGYDAYRDVPFRIIVRDDKDSLGRMLLRWEEALNSLEMCRYILKNLPEGEAVPDEKRLSRVFPKGEVFTTVEAPRGELTYYVMSAGGTQPYRVKIRTPSFNNIINSGFVYIDHELADVPVILVSFDPCISCMERVTVIDYRKGTRRKVPIKEVVRGNA
ncbi:MAG: nickel-dependent hydrogenase large subunit [Desulfurococcales archaeon]|nr:nickel-dependent hydrogenase large subunit [Desulfurococcales archaeon]